MCRWAATPSTNMLLSQPYLPAPVPLRNTGDVAPAGPSSLHGASMVPPMHAVQQTQQQQQQHNVMCVPSMQMAMQYTNTFTREAVPGRVNAAHCSLQTDLCGHTWPLSQPFPYPASAQPRLPSPHHSQPHVQQQQQQPQQQHPHLYQQQQQHQQQQQQQHQQQQRQFSVVSNGYTSHPSALSSHGTFVPFGGQMSNSAPAGMSRGGADAEAIRTVDLEPPSPPCSSPPEVPDALFDFARLDAEDELGLPFADDDSDLYELDDVLTMGHAAEQSSELFKLFTHDPDDGAGILTAHLHQPHTGRAVHRAQAAAAPWRPELPTEPAVPPDNAPMGGVRNGLHLKRGPADLTAGGVLDDVPAKRMCGSSYMSSLTTGPMQGGPGFPGNCGHVAAMIKTDLPDDGMFNL